MLIHQTDYFLVKRKWTASGNCSLKSQAGPMVWQNESELIVPYLIGIMHLSHDHE
jgi:hypothetical protein